MLWSAVSDAKKEPAFRINRKEGSLDSSIKDFRNFRASKNETMIFSILFIAEIVKYIIISNCTQAQLTQNFLEAGSIADFIIW